MRAFYSSLLLLILLTYHMQMAATPNAKTIEKIGRSTALKSMGLLSSTAEVPLG
jgi:hypothetical protein